MRRNLTSWQMQRLARSPTAMHRFMTSGKVPEGAKPDSPLIRLLRSLTPRQLSMIKHLTVDHRLGYGGSRTFHTGHQALAWLSPAYEAASYPSQSWQDQRFTKPLSIDDLSACTAAGMAAHAGARVEAEASESPTPEP